MSRAKVILDSMSEGKKHPDQQKVAKKVRMAFKRMGVTIKLKSSPGLAGVITVEKTAPSFSPGWTDTIQFVKSTLSGKSKDWGKYGDMELSTDEWAKILTFLW